MSFPSETQQIRICQILNVMPYELTWQLNWLNTQSPSARLTDAMITEIAAQIALWDAGIGTKTTKLYHTESNKGVVTQPEVARSQIRQRIAVLLERPDWASSGSYLPRG